ncbi:hypothetical protein GCM10009557_88660 [Virgisporangium ochraceum]|uniref:Uncharacterized protein n=1 Tax=Virgisporangium ochraceum TaxID=65505 RepID=A0A8J3ZPL1_9ACTN|nr:hypothetical protein [Virgisporangium ochraceum]GIJ65225.1 hypothetical protein Voc01_001420 [Virgisporangium ochraceum]
MSDSGGLIARGARDRVARARRIVERATAWPFAVRLVVFAAAMIAQGFAYPPDTTFGSPALLILLLALLPALWPRSPAVTVFWLITVAGWIAATMLYDSQVTLTRLIGLSVALYVVHSGAALAAVLPYDAVVDQGVILRWLMRAALVVVVSVALSVGALYVVSGWPAEYYLAATILGLFPVIGLVWLIVWVARRRP